jgi:hypothetical protein
VQLQLVFTQTFPLSFRASPMVMAMVMEIRLFIHMAKKRTEELMLTMKLTMRTIELKIKMN